MSDKPEISDYKRYYHRYEDFVKESACREMRRVFKWLYDGGGKYVGDYFLEKGGNLKFIQKESNRQKLRERTIVIEDMDISMMYPIMRYTCGLAPGDAQLWYDPPDSEKDCLEHSLYLLKEHRNDISHEDNEIRKLPDNDIILLMNNVRDLCRVILSKAGDKKGKVQEAAQAILDLEKDLKKSFGFQSKDISTLGRKEISDNVTKNLDFCSAVNLQNKGNSLELTDLLGTKLDEDGESSVIIVKGDAGMGKSALCQYLEYQWSTDDKTIDELSKYELVLLIRCWEVCTRNIRELLKDDLLENTLSYCDPNKIPDLLKDLQILWIFDGLEQATNEAMDLIESLIKKRNSDHTFVITSKPEYMFCITRDLKQKYSEVSLNGVNPSAYFSFLETNNDGILYSSTDIDAIIRNYEKLGDELKAELQNPLKLQIALRFWMENVDGNIQMNDDFTILYEKLVESQKKYLVRTIIKRPNRVAEEESVRKVNLWFDYLCEISFEMTSNKEIVQINNKMLKKLNKRSDDLQISSTDCVSSFLSSKAKGEYQFFHSTQQYFLAALHVASCYKSTKKIHEALKLSMITVSYLDNIKLIHLYEVLLHLIGVFQSKKIKFDADSIVKVLSNAMDIQNASPKWFEVIQKSNYNKQLLKSVSKIMPPTWFITDQNIKPANYLMKYKMPSKMIIELDSNPDMLEIKPLIDNLSNCVDKIDMEIYLNYHFSQNDKCESDKLLNVICKSDMNCNIVGFAGHLNTEHYHFLDSENIRDHCEFLQLKVASGPSLSSFSYSISQFKVIEKVVLLCTFLNYKYVSISKPLRNCSPVLIIPNIIDSQVARAAQLISKLCLNYESIIVNQLSSQKASAFVKCLMEKNVKARSFMRDMHVATERSHPMNFGPLPLLYHLSFFENIWLSTEHLTD